MTHAQRNQRILIAIAKQTERASASKEVARETLIGEGIYTKRGVLRAAYRQKKQKTPAIA